MTYNISFDICAFVNYSFILFFLVTKKSPKRRQNSIFLLLVVIALITAVFDIINSELLNSQIVTNTHEIIYLLPLNIQKIFLYISIYGYMIPHNTLSYLYLFYIFEITGLGSKKGKKFSMIWSIPVIISLIILCILNPFTGWAFFYTEALIYERGFLMYVLYGIGFFYLAASAYYLISYHSTLPLNKLIGLLLCEISIVFCVMLQFFYPYLLLELFIQSFGLLCILFTIENENEIYNPVTKVFNRPFFIEQMNHDIQLKERFHIILIRILNLNYYNQILGIDLVNKVLRTVAHWFTEITNHDSVYDCDNGVFLLVIKSSDNKTVTGYTEKIYRKFSSNWTFENIDLSFNIRLGVMNVPQTVSNIESIMSIVNTEVPKTDMRISIFTEKQILLVKRRAYVQKAIQKALLNKSFQVNYQPIWSCKEDKITCGEALIRLFDDDLGFVSPEEFIPIAERDGNILEIGHFVFDSVCRYYSKKNLSGIGLKFIQINLSPVQCMHKNLSVEFSRILQNYALSAANINLEITESSVADSPDTIQHTMQELMSLRFSFSLDDFGTGYSNLDYILNLDFNFIKLDKSILWHAKEKLFGKIFLLNTIRMIQQMKLKIIMEGVETEEQKNFIAANGIDYIQGFYFACPLPEEDFYQYCKDFNESKLISE